MKSWGSSFSDTLCVTSITAERLSQDLLLLSFACAKRTYITNSSYIYLYDTTLRPYRRSWPSSRRRVHALCPSVEPVKRGNACSQSPCRRHSCSSSSSSCSSCNSRSVAKQATRPDIAWARVRCREGADMALSIWCCSKDLSGSFMIKAPAQSLWQIGTSSIAS